MLICFEAKAQKKKSFASRKENSNITKPEISAKAL
jgi:hypothetical protein